MKYEQWIRMCAAGWMLSLLLMLAGCEYGLGNNYVDLENPAFDESKINVSLSMQDKDGMLLIEDTYLIGYLVDIPGYYVSRCIFRMGDKTWEIDKRDGEFKIDVNVFPNNIYDLTCEVYVKNTNGSVSGQAGHELYAGKKNWKLRVLARDSSDEPLQWRITDDGQVEVTWEIDESLRDAFEHYEIFFKSRPGGNFGSVSYITYRFDSRTHRHPIDERFFYESCEVFFYPKDVTARPYSLGKADLRSVHPAGTLSNPVKTDNK